MRQFNTVTKQLSRKSLTFVREKEVGKRLLVYFVVRDVTELMIKIMIDYLVE